MVILTYGNIKYQQKKIHNCDILEYIKEVIITEKNKSNINNIDYENSITLEWFVHQGVQCSDQIRGSDQILNTLIQ